MTKQIMCYKNELSAMEAIARYASKTKWFEQLGGIEGATLIALYARESGLPVMHCLFGGMRPIMGKIEISPVMMVGMIRKAGHKLEISTSTTVCVMKGTRKDNGDTYECSFSIEDAKRANLIKSGGAWDKYPEDMCFKNCASRMAKRLFSDIFGGVYAMGELEDSPGFESSSEISEAEIEITQDESGLLDNVNCVEALKKECEDLDPLDIHLESYLEKIKGKDSIQEYAKKCLRDIKRFKEFFTNHLNKQNGKQEALAI
jgi:hypothetical protein